jgi:hypothetical protein
MREVKDEALCYSALSLYFDRGGSVVQTRSLPQSEISSTGMRRSITVLYFTGFNVKTPEPNCLSIAEPLIHSIPSTDSRPIDFPFRLKT